MTKRSGVKGKTVMALARTMDAARRKAEHAQRDSARQLDLLDARPGRATRERMKLPTVEDGNGPQKSNQGPKKTSRTRRRASRKQGTTTQIGESE